MNKTAKATVELTKNDEGTWLGVEIGGRKATVSLNNSHHGPLVRDILAEWGESHFRSTGKAKKAFVILGECLLAGFVTVLLVGILAGAVWLIYAHAGAMAEGFGAALAAVLLGGVVRCFKTTRRLLRKLSGGKLFHE
jgi:CBS domain containing-hemolysin-like protein